MTHGVRQIVRFNRPFYVGASTGAALGVGAAAWLPLTAAPRGLILAATSLMLFWLGGSIAASWVIYDRSRLTRWDWVAESLGFQPAAWINIHAGLDESTPMLRRLLGGSGRVFDIFDPAEMTEPSIARARRLSRNLIAAEPVDSRRLPAQSASIDAVFLLLSAHELRTHDARSALFAELRRILTPGGRVVVAEHLRDVANFAAFGPGFLHFHSRRTWLCCFRTAQFLVHGEFRITPFIRVFILRSAS